MSMFEQLPTLGLDTLVVSVGDALAAFPPTYYVVLLVRILTEFLLDRVALVILSFLLGAVFVLASEVFVFWSYFNKAPILPPPKCPDVRTELPEVLMLLLDNSNLKQKEDCVWLNFLLQFLFSELRDSLLVRRFLTKKIQLEFEEVLKSRSGVLVDELFLRDYNLGDKFPVITGLSVDRSDVCNDTIQTLDLKAHIAYDGGFQIAIDAALPFHRMAFVSVKVLKLQGVLRLQFTQLPFSHWNASFYEEPELEVDVTAQLDGRPMPKLKNIIANQIRKIIRKKHTLPMYKMRYKPFFQPRPDPGLARDTRIQIDNAELGCGTLEVTVVEANRLPVVVKGAKVYCTVSVDELPWKEQMLKERKTRIVITVELVKNSSDQSLGMTVKDELIPDRLHPVVMIGEIAVGSPAHMANIQQGDILAGIAGNKVTSAKQAMKNLKWAKDRIQIQVERAGLELPTSISTKDDILLVPQKANSWHDGCMPEKNMDAETLSNTNTGSSAPSQLTTGSPKFRSKTQHQQLLSEGNRTTFRNASVNPQWNHKFSFSVDSSVNYLNICLWSKGGDRTDKPEMISSTKQDVLLGYVSLHLDEIYLHSLVTLNGTMHDRVKLKHGHYKTEDELAKTWSVHKGWDPNQMYGDISLAFHYDPTDLTPDQRRMLSGSKAAAVKLQGELFERYKTDEDDQGKPSPARIAEDLKRDLNEGHHQFDNTTFMTATFCDYCGKKIWMKEAFKCQTCNMACHKKCLVKCLVNTVCTDAGAKKRSSVDEAWEPLASTGKLKRPVVADEVVRNYGFPEEEAASQDNQATNDTSITTSESLQNLTTLFDGIYSEPEQKVNPNLPGTSRQDSMQEASSVTRFRSLKEQTDRMKDNVLKHLRKTKIPTSFNDKAILSAKELGARLYLDMEPTLRKDKLEELVKKLDQELKAEMENKESVELELNVLEAAEQKAPSSKRKSEIRVLTNKIIKSVEKQDAMRLLMLQYCSGLQNCINSLEADVNVSRGKPEFTNRHQTLPKDGEQTKTLQKDGEQTKTLPKLGEQTKPLLKDGEQSKTLQKDGEHSKTLPKHGEQTKTLPKDGEQSKPSRSGAVGVFVRKASSSVKEKMSFIKKDFGKKGTKNEEEDKTLSSKSNNNSGLLVIDEGDAVSFQDIMEETTIDQTSRNKDREFVDGLTENTDSAEGGKGSGVAEMPSEKSDGTSAGKQHPVIEICVDNADIPAGDIDTVAESCDSNEPNVLSQKDSGLPRSSSDSKLEVSKMFNLRPEDILRYHGTSLPRLLTSDDSDSESDYLVIDSSDEHVVTDSSDSENDENVDFKDGKKKSPNDDDDDMRGQHRNTVQQLQTFQV